MNFNQYWATQLSEKFQGQLMKETPELLEQKNIALKAWYAALKVGDIEPFLLGASHLDLYITEVNSGSSFYAAPELLNVDYTKEDTAKILKALENLSANSYAAINELGCFELYDEYQAVLTTSGIDLSYAGKYWMSMNDMFPITNWETKVYSNGGLQFVIYLDNDPGEIWADLGNIYNLLKT